MTLRSFLHVRADVRRVSLLALAAISACSLIVENRETQCESNEDCSAFENAVCDQSSKTCVVVTGGTGGATGTSTGTSTSSTSSSGGGSDGGTDLCTVANKPIVDISGEITSDFILTCDKDYRLIGEVVVTAGATLTIQKNTTIKGFFDAANPAVLVIQPGAKLLAVGTADEPIVFTSELPANQRQPGDWGGVILLGNAPTNIVDANNMPTQGKIEGVVSGGLYGGTDPDDSSGSLKYLRIEYGGVAIAPNNEVNGLTFGGVGRGTLVDYIQVRQSADDCFEFFGGTVNAKHLACQYNGDDGFDWDNGYTGKLQFLVLQQDPSIADDTNGFEGDNDALATQNLPLSEPTIYNATLCGKNIDVNKQQYGMLLRRSTKAHIFNTIATGFEAGWDLRNPTTNVDLQSSIFFGNLIANIAYAETVGGAAPLLDDDDGGLDEIAIFMDPAKKNSAMDPQIPGCFDANAPAFGPMVSLTANAATPPNDGFFDVTANYIGAFKDANDAWATSGKWVVWAAK